MSERISLSLSPTGANAAGTARVVPVVTHALIAAHMRQARKLRADTMTCMARQFWSWLTRSSAVRPRDCDDADWLRPQAAG